MEEAGQDNAGASKKQELTKLRTMEKAGQDNAGASKKQELTKLQHEIYELLRQNKPQKALAIAKAVGKTSAKQVNPDLYTMNKINLLECNEDKLWSVKREGCVSEDTTKTKQLDRTKDQQQTNEARRARELSDQQKEILTVLEKDQPMRATDIAKVMGRTSAKDVNPDLYRMKDMDLLSYNQETKLWAVTSQKDGRSREENKERRSSDVPLRGEHTDGAFSPTQDNRDGTPCGNGGISSSNHTTPPPTAGNAVQTYCVVSSSPSVVKYINIHMVNSHITGIGDYCNYSGYDQSVCCAPGDDAEYMPDAANTEPEARQQVDNSWQTESCSVNHPEAEAFPGPSQRSSTPSHPDRPRQGLNMASICNALERLNLEKQDNVI